MTLPLVQDAYWIVTIKSIIDSFELLYLLQQMLSIETSGRVIAPTTPYFQNDRLGASALKKAQ
jgi:hypothetical protein